MESDQSFATSLMAPCKAAYALLQLQLDTPSSAPLLHTSHWHCLIRTYDLLLNSLHSQLQQIASAVSHDQCHRILHPDQQCISTLPTDIVDIDHPRRRSFNCDGRVDVNVNTHGAIHANVDDVGADNLHQGQLLIIKKDISIPLKALCSTMHEALQFMADCTAPTTSNSPIAIREWRVRKALPLGMSTEVVDIHLHDLMWVYATSQLVIHHHYPQPDVESALKKELEELQSIWANMAESRITDASTKELTTIIQSDGNEAVGQFILERLKHAQTVEDQANVDMEHLYQNPIPQCLLVDPITVAVDRVILGIGGFGVVYKAHFGGVDAFALKNFFCVYGSVFDREAAIQATLSHPNVMQLVGCLTSDYDDDKPCDQSAEQLRSCSLLMERMEQNLSAFIRRRKLENAGEDASPFTLLEAVDLMLQIAKGMEYLHRRHIIHCDLKPSNILVGFPRRAPAARLYERGGADTLLPAVSGWLHLKISDFGTSKGKLDENAQFTTPPIGTTTYRAPEVAEEDSKEKYTRKADVYSYGILCSEIMTGNTPFESNIENLRWRVRQWNERPALPEDCPHALASLIRSCWHGNAAKRPSFSHICRVLRLLKASLLLLDTHFCKPFLHISHVPAATSSTVFEAKLATLCCNYTANINSPAHDVYLTIPCEMYCCNMVIQEAIQHSESSSVNSISTGPFHPRSFTYKEIKEITKHFSKRIDGCGAQEVFEGWLENGQRMVVVRASVRTRASTSAISQGHTLGAELEVVSQLQHPNIVPLLGWCNESPLQLLVVYERLPHGDLATNLFKTRESSTSNNGPSLTYERRCKIIEQLASALHYLHSGQHHNLVIIHSDVKTSNVMLDSTWNAKLGGFNFTRILHHGHGDIAPCITWTTPSIVSLGYGAPEILTHGMSTASDVYSFGVVILTVVCGEEALQLSEQGLAVFLRDKVWHSYTNNMLPQIVDSRLQNELGASFETSHMKRLLLLGLACTDARPHARPSMDRVLQMLRGHVEVQVPDAI